MERKEDTETTTNLDTDMKSIKRQRIIADPYSREMKKEWKTEVLFDKENRGRPRAKERKRRSKARR